MGRMPHYRTLDEMMVGMALARIRRDVFIERFHPTDGMGGSWKGSSQMSLWPRKPSGQGIVSWLALSRVRAQYH
ncbi:hypothetical protein TNCV_2734411 [Trichonephila clavipes]|nr:hypothetical protein TNCV_2734411 [Trichonephila clavipes]